MGKYVINSGQRLKGSVRVQGSKNSALPILTATVVVGKPCVIHNCPNLTDVDATVNILKELGCKVSRKENTVFVDSSYISKTCISEKLMREMRSSVIFMGALLSRMGEAVVTSPGGCDIGLRPIDLHLTSMQKLGVNISEEHGVINCKCSRVTGNKITLSFPSVGATENIILASVRSKGITTIINAAREPEIVDLVRFLNACGAHISGAGESVVYIEGVENLHSAQYTVMSDRIAAATYMAAAAVTGSDIMLEELNAVNIFSVVSCFEQAGCRISFGNNRVRIQSPERLHSMEQIRTMPYPGFPTDFQPIVMVMASVAQGITVINENIFENRFRISGELNRMGAKIKIHDRVAVVCGVHRLQGCNVCATDLRAGAGLVVAGLCADGETVVDGIHFIDRGYEKLCDNLLSLGANIKRI